jgi:3-keto-disaccharide hydrolase
MSKKWMQPVLAVAAITTLSFISPGTTSWFAGPDNTLSAKEKKEGWKLLFDGKTTTGWKMYKDKASDGWMIAGGELSCKLEGVKTRADLITVDQYGDFELSIDWKVAPGANGGIVYRCNEENGSSYQSGNEYQLIDDLGYKDKLEDWQKSGADYAMHPPTKLAANPAGQYNTTRIVAKGAHVEHWLNGVKVADFEMWTPEWQALKAKSKFKDMANWATSKSGQIALQDHGGGLTFKNIKIRKL